MTTIIIVIGYLTQHREKFHHEIVCYNTVSCRESDCDVESPSLSV